MSEDNYRIRLRYSSIINYLSMLYRLFVAIGFIVVVARKLSVTEFALWGIIVSVSYMMSSLTLFWSYWSQRYHARGDTRAAGTGFVTTILYWIPAIFLYLLISFLEEHLFGWGFRYLLIGAPYMLFVAMNSYLNSLADVTKPELRGYSGFIYETLRLVLALILVAIVKKGLLGALISVEIAMAVSLIYKLIILINKKILRITFSKQLLVGWLKNLHVPLLTMLNDFLRNGIRAIVSWMTGNELVVAYLNIGLSSEGPLIQSSQAASPALYARLLRKETGQDITTSLRIFFTFSGFLLTTFIFLSKTIASVFNPSYIKVHLVIPGIAIYAFLLGLSILYETVLKGIEKIDKEKIPTLKEVNRTDLFKIPFIRLLSTIFSILLMYVFVKIIAHQPELQAYMITLAMIIGVLPLTVYLIRRGKKRIPHDIPYRELLAVFLGGSFSAFYYIVTNADDIVIRNFWLQTPILLLHLILSAIIYISTIILLSPWTRALLKEGFSRTTTLFITRKKSDKSEL